MTVAVQKELIQLRKQLRALGFDVVEHNERAPRVDAYIYDSETGASLFPESLMPKNGGVFMVNAKQKTVGEVAKMLERRLYDPLV